MSADLTRAQTQPLIRRAEKLKAERRAEALRPWNQLQSGIAAWLSVPYGIGEIAPTTVEPAYPVARIGKSRVHRGALAPMEWEASMTHCKAIDEFAKWAWTRW